MDIEDILASHVRGQPAAAASVAGALAIATAGLTLPTRPLSVLLFTGPTGVGKTSMVRAVASVVRDGPDDFCRIDMSALSQEHYAASFSGAPPGYAGSREGHSLFVREDIEGTPLKPGIVLFDEVEKAHPVVLRALLHVLDSGVMRLSAGTSTLDFRNCHVFMTSNLGSRAAIRGNGKLPVLRRTSRSGVQAAVKRFFDPEFLNRIDEIVEFDPISRAVAAEIVDIELARIVAKVSRRGVRLTVSDSARRHLVDTGFDRAFGARALHRAIRTHLLVPLATTIGSANVRSVAVGLAPDGTLLCDAGEVVEHPDEEGCLRQTVGS
jgi:ATP-dependent Clp protease ATP-binding subunit ClpA